MKKSNVKWEDLPAPKRAALVGLSTVEIVITVVAAIDLMRRPKQSVRGSKLMWAAAFAVQPFGPIIYLAAGRVEPELTSA